MHVLQTTTSEFQCAVATLTSHWWNRWTSILISKTWITQHCNLKPHIYYFIKFQGIVIASGVTYEPLKAELSNRVVVYPEWGNILGWMFVICAFLWVPSYAIYTVLGKYTMGKTWKQRLAMCISPEKEHKSILNGNKVKRFQVTIRLYVYRLWLRWWNTASKSQPSSIG